MWFEGDHYEENNFNSVICYTHDVFPQLVSKERRLEDSKISDFFKYFNNYNAYFMNIDSNKVLNIRTSDKALPVKTNNEIFEQQYDDIKQRLRSQGPRKAPQETDEESDRFDQEKPKPGKRTTKVKAIGIDTHLILPNII